MLIIPSNLRPSLPQSGPLIMNVTTSGGHWHKIFNHVRRGSSCRRPVSPGTAPLVANVTDVRFEPEPSLPERFACRWVQVVSNCWFRVHPEVPQLERIRTSVQAFEPVENQRYH